MKDETCIFLVELNPGLPLNQNPGLPLNQNPGDNNDKALNFTKTSLHHGHSHMTREGLNKARDYGKDSTKLKSKSKSNLMDLTEFVLCSGAQEAAH